MRRVSGVTGVRRSAAIALVACVAFVGSCAWSTHKVVQAIAPAHAVKGAAR